MANLVFPRSVLFGEFEADLVAGELRKNGLPEKILLQEQPLAILRALVARPGEMVSREELFQLLWNGNTNVDFDPSLNKAINRLRISLGDSAEAPRYIETLSRRGYRFICPVVTEVPTGLPETADSTPAERKNLGALGQIKTRWKKILPAVTAGVALAAGTYFYFHRTPKLTDKDTIVLADFTNTTGDSVFDGALRQGLAVQLEQSPFLSLVSDERIRQTLRLMGRPVDAKLTPGIARELCQRIGATVVLDGFIAQIGTQYSLILKVVKCSNGESLTSTEAQANDKSQVLNALGRAASNMRKKLGESHSSIQKFDTPLEQATTSSFEALQAFSLGWKTFFEGEEAPAALLFQRAIRLDPSFAMAYALLGLSYANQGESIFAAEHIRKAFELRASVSEREKFFIETVYYDRVNGDTGKSRQVLEVWAQTYPRDWLPLEALGDTFHSLGEHEKSLEEHLKALRLSPETVLIYSVIVYNRISLNQLREAHATIEDMKRKNLDSNHLCGTLYGLAFLEDDTAGMAKQAAWSADKPGMEDYILGAEADTAAYYGQLRKARRFSDRAVTSARRVKLNEAAAGYEASAALREAFLGNSAMSQHRVTSALEPPTGRDVQYLSALSLAAAGDPVRAEALASDLGKRFPDDTIVQLMYLPILRAQLALSRNDAPKAIEALQTATTYELGEVSLSPAYIRGQAYLATHQGNEAAAEFQKILDHRGIVLNAPIGALAHLGLARAHVLQGDTAKARAAYQDFLALWKDADPNIPILVAAKAEYAKLK